DQNPLIENISMAGNGIYTVTASANGCTSPPVTTELDVVPIPEFILETGCNNNDYTVAVVATGNPLPITTTYTWSGPENYTSSDNLIKLTGLSGGLYSVTVSVGSCEVTAQVNVNGTFCTFPLGISPNNDGSNDTFNLSGFDVQYI